MAHYIDVRVKITVPLEARCEVLYTDVRVALPELSQELIGKAQEYALRLVEGAIDVEPTGQYRIEPDKGAQMNSTNGVER